MLAALICNLSPRKHDNTGGKIPGGRIPKRRNIFVRWISNKELDARGITITGDDKVTKEELSSAVVDVVRSLGDYESLTPFTQKAIEPILKYGVGLSTIRKSDIKLDELLTNQVVIEQIINLSNLSDEEDAFLLILSTEL